MNVIFDSANGEQLNFESRALRTENAVDTMLNLAN